MNDAIKNQPLSIDSNDVLMQAVHLYDLAQPARIRQRHLQTARHRQVLVPNVPPLLTRIIIQQLRQFIIIEVTHRQSPFDVHLEDEGSVLFGGQGERLGVILSTSNLDDRGQSENKASNSD